MSKVDRFGMIFIGFLIGVLLSSGGTVEEVVVEKEIPAVSAEIGEKHNPGSYKVGRDIPAGEYKCEKIRGDGFEDWIIVKIATDANFENTIRYDIEHNTALFSCETGNYVKIEHANFYLIEKYS